MHCTHIGLWRWRHFRRRSRSRELAATYGIDGPYFDYRAASRGIGARLLNGIEVTVERLREALSADLDRRLRILQSSIKEAFPWPEVVLDEILKSEAFDCLYDAESGASKRYRDILRFIGQGGQIPKGLYRRREREYLESVRSVCRIRITCDLGRRSTSKV